MAIIASDKGGNEFERAPAGQYSAVCYRVVDLGTQAQTDKMGKVSHKRKIIIGWELDERMSDGRRFSQQERYTLSLHEMSSLRPMLESWRGRPFTPEEAANFDVAKLIGAPALIQIVHKASEKGGIYVNMSSIMKLPKGMEALVPENEVIEFSLAEFDQATFDKLSDKLKETIMKSPEYMELKKPTVDYEAHVSELSPDEIAF